jgi:hypothetical protein
VKTDLKRYTVAEILEGFVYNELEGKGLFGLAGKLSSNLSTNGITSTTTARRMWPSSIHCSRATRWG